MWGGRDERGGMSGGGEQRQLLRAEPITENKDGVGRPKEGGVDLGAS